MIKQWNDGLPAPSQRKVAWALAAVALAMTCAMLVAAITSYVRTGDGIGGDFLTDYAGGRLVRMGDSALLYDLEAQERTQREISPAGVSDDVNPFVATPAVAWAFVPLSVLPYRFAHLLFTVFNLIALAGAVLLLRSELASVSPGLRNALLFGFALSMPAVTNISWGQIDLVLVCGALLGWRCLRADREVWAGVALSLLLLKPHFAVGIVVLMLIQRRWTTLGTLAAMSVPMAILPALALGQGALGDYLGLVTGAQELPAYIDTQPQHMANWRGLVTGLIGRDDPRYWLPGAVLIAVAALWLAARAWRREPVSARSYAMAILVPLLLSPHVHMQSLMLLFVAIGLLVEDGGMELLNLGRLGRLDGVSAVLGLYLALFVGWFLTANDISLMVFAALGVFAWASFAPFKAEAEPAAAQALLQAA